MASNVERWVAEDEGGNPIKPPLDFETKEEAEAYEMGYLLRHWLLQQIAGGDSDLHKKTLNAICETCASSPGVVRSILRY